MDSSRSTFIDELTELFLLSMEGKINEQQFQCLQRSLSGNAVLRKYYYDFVSTYVGLNDPQMLSEPADLRSPLLDQELWKHLAEAEKAAPSVDHSDLSLPLEDLIQEQRHPIMKQRVNKRSLIIGIVSLAAMLLIVVGIHLLPSRLAKPVASLTGSYNTRWSSSRDTMENGVRFWNDGQWYHLDQGIAEVTFDKGARVLVEAPGRFQVLNENEMVFEGALTASVPQSAYGFTINTSNSKIVDLGTEFGLRATNADESDIYVAKGKVEVVETVSSEKAPGRQFVKTGQGCRVDDSGEISSECFQKDEFCWLAPSPYEQAVYQTQPLCYWRFDRNRGTLLKNEMNPELRPQNQLIGSIRYGQGPVLDNNQSNRSLRLNGSNETYAVLLDRAVDFRRSHAISISVWVYPEEGILLDQSVLLTTCEKGPDVSFNDQIFFTANREFGFYVYCPKALRRMSIISQPVQPGQWYHVAVSRTPDQIKLYVNGQLCAVDDLPAPGGETSSLSYGCIGRGTGHYEGASVKYQKWPFTGLVDELSQYDRELTAEEVELLYHAAEEPQGRQ